MDNRVVELLQARHATRAISTDPLKPGVADELAEAIRLTPSCYNKQPWRFVFLEGEGPRSACVRTLAEGNRAWASHAPLLVVGYARREDDCVIPDGRAYYQFDLGMAVMNLMLAATDRGLVARPMAGFDPEAVRNAFDLAPDDEPMIVVAVGSPSEDESHLPDHFKGAGAASRSRKPVGEVVAVR